MSDGQAMEGATLHGNLQRPLLEPFNLNLYRFRFLLIVFPVVIVFALLLVLSLGVFVIPVISIGVAVGVAIGFAIFVILFFRVVLVFLVVVTPFFLVAFRRPGRPNLVAQRDDHENVRIGINKSRTEVFIHRRREITMAREKQIVAFAIEHRRSILEHPAGHLVLFTRFYVIEPNGTHPVGTTLVVRDPPRIRRPTQGGAPRPGIHVDQLRRSTLQRVKIDGTAHIAKGDVLRIGRPNWVIAKQLAVAGQLPCLALPVGLLDIQLILARLIAEISKPLTVRAPGRIALRHAVGPREVSR